MRKAKARRIPRYQNQTYNEFYAAMKDWGRYELVSTPTDADLIFEIRFAVTLGPVIVSQGSGMSPQNPQLRLVIFDPKTHVGLWAFTEQVKQARLPANERKNFKQFLAKLVDEVKALAGK